MLSRVTSPFGRELTVFTFLVNTIAAVGRPLAVQLTEMESLSFTVVVLWALFTVNVVTSAWSANKLLNK